MLDGLLRILTGVDDADRAGERNDPAFSLAVLLIEVARSDDTVEAREQGLIERALARRFRLQPGEVTRLVQSGGRERDMGDGSIPPHPCRGREFHRGRTYWRHRDVVGGGPLRRLAYRR
jgi:hypothetical protein